MPLIILESVGSVYDTGTDIVYPLNDNETPDLNCGTYLGDCCQEWFDSLSNADERLLLNLFT